MRKKSKKKKEMSLFLRILYLLIGLFLFSLSFNVFMVPNSFVAGGVSGVAIIANYLFGWDNSLFIMICSIILLFISFIFLGKEKTMGSVLGSLLLPVFVNLTSYISVYLQVEESLLLSAIFAGVLAGTGYGLVFKAGFTTGGTDIINQIISKYLKKPLGTAMLMSDGLIVLSGVFVFGISKLMYGIIILYIISILTDKVVLGISDSKAFYIVTDKDQEIKDYIINELGHGVTVFQAKGAYTKEKQDVLFCVIPTKEYFALKEGIRLIDKDAFFVVNDSYQVVGGE